MTKSCTFKYTVSNCVINHPNIINSKYFFFYWKKRNIWIFRCINYCNYAILSLGLYFCNYTTFFWTTPSPRITRFPLVWFALMWILAYVHVSGEILSIISTVPLTWFLRNAVFLKKQNVRNAGNRCFCFRILNIKFKVSEVFTALKCYIKLFNLN